MRQSSATTRITPALLADAFAVEFRWVYRQAFTPEQAVKHRQAAWRAVEAIIDGVRWERSQDGKTFWFESQSALKARAKGETVHPDQEWNQCPAPDGAINPICDCRGSNENRVCWHPAGARMIARILDIDEPLPFDARKAPLVKPKPVKPTTPRALVMAEAAELEVN